MFLEKNLEFMSQEVKAGLVKPNYSKLRVVSKTF